ncbi:kinase-like protein [Xylariaceae sp. FL1651]|nr:kinase-like protein [Xylariaceae sp. FL1651]
MSSISAIGRSGRLRSMEISAEIRWTDYHPHKTSRQSTNVTGHFSGSLQGIDFMNVLNASAKYGVPSIELRKPRLVNPESERQTITLGSGLTSEVVQYVMTEKDPVKVPSGKIVALKTFRRTSPDKVARQTVYESILREIDVLCHPLIAGHPNIVQLHFVGWRKGEAFPRLGMEYGLHGSLDYLIRSSWPGLTEVQIQQIRQHITIDIAMGLHAIHKAGFIHGDLKPENILIMSHASESHRVVAKLTDFGGSAQSADREGGRPIHYTPLWCAPEVLNEDPDVDWERADVYSYGLVVGSLWASIPGGGGFGAGRLNESSSCFLAAHLPSGLSKEDEKSIFWFIKSEYDEESENNIKFLLRKRLEITVPNEIGRTQLFDAIAPTLTAHFWLRPSIEELSESLHALAVQIQRNTWYVALSLLYRRAKINLAHIVLKGRDECHR